MSTLKVGAIRGVSASSDAVTVSNDGTCTANITNNLSNRNKVINGAMQVAQRGTSTSSVTAIGYFACDRQKTQLSSAGTWTISQSTEAPSDNGFKKSMKYDCTTADGSLGANDYLQHYYRIEGQDLQDVRKGTSSAKPLILSFWVKTNKTGTYNVEVIDQDNSRLCSKSYTVSDSNWNKYTFVFPADTTGAFNDDNGVSLDIGWWLAAGSTYSSGSNQTSFGSFVQANRAPGNVNLADSTSNEWYITGIQLEVDQTGSGVATDFEHRSFADEFQKCLRYYEQMSNYGQSSGYFAVGYNENTTQCNHALLYKVYKRATPTITSNGDSNFKNHNTGTSTALSNLSIQAITPQSARCEAHSGSAVLTDGGCSVLASLNTGEALLKISAEL